MTDDVQFPRWDDAFRDMDALAAYLEAVREWGEEDQLQKAAEECSELSAAINKYLLGQCSKRELEEEMIDVRQSLEIVATTCNTEQLREAGKVQVEDFQQRVENDDPGGEEVSTRA